MEGAADIRIGKMLAQLWGSTGITSSPTTQHQLRILRRAWPGHVVHVQPHDMEFVSQDESLVLLF
jgi:hypothetical protein